jgi:hypothetical protein
VSQGNHFFPQKSNGSKRASSKIELKLEKNARIFFEDAYILSEFQETLARF